MKGQTNRFIRLCAVASLGLLGFPTYQLLSGGSPPLPAATTLAGVVLFATVYTALWQSSLLLERPGVTLGAILLLAAIAIPLNLAYPHLTWTYLFAYLAGTAGFALPGRQGLAGVAGTALLALAALLLMGSHWTPAEQLHLPRIAITGVLALFLVGLGALGARRLMDTAAELRAAREELARRAVEEERHRFARDVHDLLGHSLSVITLKSALAGRLVVNRPAAAAAEVRDIESVARRALQEMRDAVGGYRRPSLPTEIAEARNVLATANITFHVDEEDAPLPRSIETIFAWAVREGTTNILRHSRATECTLHILRQNGLARLVMIDDGITVGVPAAGSGLIGLQERVERGGGRLEAGQMAEGGFRLCVTLPAGERPHQDVSMAASGGEAT